MHNPSSNTSWFFKMTLRATVLLWAACPCSSAIAASVASDTQSTPAIPASTLTLEMAVEIGMAHSPELRAARANVERATADAGAARAGRRMTIATTADAKRTETFRSNSIFGLDEDLYSGSVTVNQPVYTSGRLSHSIDAATHEQAAAIAGLADKTLAVEYQITSAFISLLLAQDRESVAQESLGVAEALLGKARAKESQGLGTRFDVLRAEADAAANRAKLLEAAAAVSKSREALAVTMGMSPATPLSIRGSLIADEPVPPLDDVESVALRERPDLAIIHHRLRAARSRAEYERSRDKPELSAVASGSYARHDYKTQSAAYSGRDQSSGYVGAQMTFPFYDGNLASERSRAQDAAARELEAQAGQARLAAAQEIRGIFVDLDAARATITARADGVRASTEALRMAELAFAEGKASSLDVIQASLTLSDAKRAESEAAFSYRLGIARLIRAAGGRSVISDTGARP